MFVAVARTEPSNESERVFETEVQPRFGGGRQDDQGTKNLMMTDVGDVAEDWLNGA